MTQSGCGRGSRDANANDRLRVSSSVRPPELSNDTRRPRLRERGGNSRSRVRRLRTPSPASSTASSLRRRIVHVGRPSQETGAVLPANPASAMAEPRSRSDNRTPLFATTTPSGRNALSVGHGGFLSAFRRSNAASAPPQRSRGRGRRSTGHRLAGHNVAARSFSDGGWIGRRVRITCAGPQMGVVITESSNQRHSGGLGHPASRLTP